jgi:hypothetical protein
MKQRLPIILLALLAASLFALSVQAGRWWSVESFELGPFGSRLCDASGECRPLGLGVTDVRWTRFGMATWAAGMIAMIVLVVIAGAVAARRTPRLVAKMALVAVATALLTGAGFIALRPPLQGLHVDRGVPMFALAIVLGAAAALLVLRRRA